MPELTTKALERAMESFLFVKDFKPIVPNFIEINPECVDDAMGVPRGTAAEAAENGLLRVSRDENGAVRFWIEDAAPVGA